MVGMAGDPAQAGMTTVHLRPTENGHSRERASSLSFRQNRLHRLSTISSRLSSRPANSVESKADINGPLGLNLLNEPSEPRVDFIFIHGLGGGSRKTWSYSPDPHMFWPKEWLPNETGFRHVRLHSYGYNSDWTTRKDSHLTVHDFGQALLADLRNSPHLRKNGHTPIVFVAHSMGGLVAKKTYLLATRDPIYQDIARRIHTMYFLGTPHRGADSAHIAKLLRRSVGYGTKAFLDDLVPGSDTLYQINDEFRHVCENIRLWSFAEGLPTSFGLTSSLVVEKESAVLGLPKEHVRYIEADHRHICKFDSPTNPNYMTLRKAFLTTVEDLEADAPFRRRDEYTSQMKKVASLLRVDQRPDAVLLATSEKQHSGSCQWLTESKTFQEWVENPVVCSEEEIAPSKEPPLAKQPKILWLKGRPGTGKSVAAGHVVRYLQTCNLDCSFYFFEHKNQGGSTVAAFLRSLAFQMAESSFEVRRTVVSMAEDGIKINHDDHHMLWTSLFAERILKVEYTRPQFWVIDAVDECSTKGMPALVSMLSSLGSKTPVRVFMTSRPGGQLGRLLSWEWTEFSEITTGQEGSLRDIELFVKARCSGASDTGLVADVLAKCNGVFLWASLTVAKLEEAYSVEDKQDILRQIPPEMDMFYSRIITSIAGSPSSELARCILKWTICSPRPLYYGELAEAVKLDISRTLTTSASELETMAGHLVFVDTQSQIHIMHQTASEFLTRKREGFWIDRAAAHSKLAEICLTVLCGTEFAPPRLRRGGTTKSTALATKSTVLSPLADYAALNFSYHLMHGSAAADGPLILLNKFLKSNVLTWIEKTASTDNLWTLQITAQRLKAYLGRRAKYQSLVSVETETVARWAADIYHIVAAFHSSLLTSPSSIYLLIPQLCPPKSIIRKLFAKPSGQLRIAGSSEEDWSERLACYLFPEEASAVTCCARFLAVGLTDGDIRIYCIAGSDTFDSAGTLAHGKKVRQLAFNRSSSLLASCSARKLMLWDIHTSSRGSSFPCLWSRNLDFTPSHMAFHPDGNSVVLANPQHSSIVAFEAADGRKGEPILLHALVDSDSSSSDDESGDEQVAAWTPSEWIRLDASHRLAALAYRNATVLIWDLDSVEEIGKFEREGFEDVYVTAPPLDMIFNPISELELLAITYKDGDMVTCNPWTLEQTNKCHLPVLLFTLATTSDGRVLAGATDDGEIYLFLWETLQRVYKINRLDDQFRIHDIVFSTDNRQLFDIRGHSCTVWEPFILAPRDESDDGKSSEAHSEEDIVLESPVSLARVFEWGRAITAIEQADHGNCLMVGRQDGTIEICELRTGDVMDKLALHDSFAEIEHIDWNEEKGVFLSVDTIGRCILTRLSFIKQGTTKVQTCCLLDHREGASVRQALIGPKAESLLICTESSAKIIGLDGGLVAEETCLPGSWWMRHLSNDSHLIAIQENTLHLFEWASLKRLSQTDGIALLVPEFPVQVTSRNPWISGAGSSYFAQCIVDGASRVQTSNIFALDTSEITLETKAMSLQTLYTESLRVQAVLGCLKSRLFILETSGWVCSISLKRLSKATHYTRHFFIPHTWRSGGGDIVIKVVSKTAVAFGRGEQLMIFHGFLEFEEKAAL